MQVDPKHFEALAARSHTQKRTKAAAGDETIVGNLPVSALPALLASVVASLPPSPWPVRQKETPPAPKPAPYAGLADIHLSLSGSSLAEQRQRHKSAMVELSGSEQAGATEHAQIAMRRVMDSILADAANVAGNVAPGMG
jgi:hypothetical protein